MEVNAISTIESNARYNDQSQLSYPSCYLLPSKKVCHAIKNGCQIHAVFVRSIVYFAEILVPKFFFMSKRQQVTPVSLNVSFMRCHAEIVL